VTATPTTPPSVRAELFGPERRATTVGLVLLISLVAFEAMGVGTAMPALVADLGRGDALLMACSSRSSPRRCSRTVLGGRWSDRSGPRAPILVGTLLFGVGLLVAGTATGMPQLLVGRVLQGLGAGSLAVATFVLIAAVYPERLRPPVFGLISSAWVLPSLLGPPVAGVVTEPCRGTGCSSASCRWWRSRWRSSRRPCGTSVRPRNGRPPAAARRLPRSVPPWAWPR
jgi:MFS family permease